MTSFDGWNGTAGADTCVGGAVGRPLADRATAATGPPSPPATAEGKEAGPEEPDCPERTDAASSPPMGDGAVAAEEDAGGPDGKGIRPGAVGAGGKIARP